MVALAFRFGRVLSQAEAMHQELGWDRKGPPYLAQEAIDKLFAKKILVLGSALGDGINGYIHRDDEKLSGVVLIEYNSTDSLPVRNATLGHELGHFVLEHLEGEGKRERRCRITGQNGLITDPQEREANTFMAEFLVPLDRLGRIFREDVAKLWIDDREAFDEEVDLLSTKFQVSRSFIVRQLWRLHRRRKDRWGM